MLPMASFERGTHYNASPCASLSSNDPVWGSNKRMSMHSGCGHRRLDAIVSSQRGCIVTSVLVVTEFFPALIQPWLLNSVEQICSRGRVTIAASADGGGAVAEKVFELGLLDRTVYCPMTGNGLIKQLFNPGNFFNMLRQPSFWRGLGVLGMPPLDVRKLLKHIALARVAGRDRYDIIHAHHEISAYEFLPLARALNMPLILTFHGKPPPGVAELAMPKREALYEFVSLVQVNTQFAAQQVIDLGCAPDKIRILPQGTDLKEFPFCPRPPFQNRQPLVILTVARVQADKGHRYAIEAVARLIQAGHPIEYRIAGSGPEAQALQSQIKALGMEGSITMLGPIPRAQLLEEYRNAHVFILPSLRDLEGKHEETQGVVIQEAQASGKIVIATRVGGVPECVEEGVSAFLVEDRSADAFEKAILEILHHPEKWQDWQKKAREWVETRYDINVIGEKQWALYQEAIAEKRLNLSRTL